MKVFCSFSPLCGQWRNWLSISQFSLGGHLPLDGGGWEGVLKAPISERVIPPPHPSPQGGGCSIVVVAASDGHQKRILP
jgi:hypothetical protein